MKRRGRVFPASSNEREFTEDVLIYSFDLSSLSCGGYVVPIVVVDRRSLSHPTSRIELNSEISCELAQVRPSINDISVGLVHGAKIHRVSWIVNSPCFASEQGARYG